MAGNILETCSKLPHLVKAWVLSIEDKRESIQKYEQINNHNLKRGIYLSADGLSAVNEATVNHKGSLACMMKELRTSL